VVCFVTFFYFLGITKQILWAPYTFDKAVEDLAKGEAIGPLRGINPRQIQGLRLPNILLRGPIYYHPNNSVARTQI